MLFRSRSRLSGSSDQRGRRATDPEERFTQWVTIGFIALIAAVVAIVLVAFVVSYWNDHLKPVATVGDVSISRDQWTARAKVEYARLDHEEKKVRESISAQTIDPDVANARLQQIQTEKTTVSTDSIEHLIDLELKGRLAREAGLAVTDADVVLGYLNPVALLVVKALVQGPWRDPEGITESPPIVDAGHLPQLIDKSRLHLGFLVALVLLAIAWWVLSRTAIGLRIRAVGLAPHAARFAGIRVERTLLGVALVSGAIAGIAGVSEVAGIQFRLTSGVSAGYGYTGIVVAMLGGLSMPGVLLSALFLGDLRVGTNKAESALDIPSQIGAVVQGVILLSVVGLLAIRRRRIARADRPADEAEPPPADELHTEGAPG